MDNMSWSFVLAIAICLSIVFGAWGEDVMDRPAYQARKAHKMIKTEFVVYTCGEVK